jgi:hypothetical protein
MNLSILQGPCPVISSARHLGVGKYEYGYYGYGDHQGRFARRQRRDTWIPRSQ